MDVDGLGARFGMSIEKTTMLEEAAMENWHKYSERGEPQVHSPQSSNTADDAGGHYPQSLHQ